MRSILLIVALGCWLCGVAQDDVIQRITLTPVVVHARGGGSSMEGTIRQVMEDTTFHQAFLNTKYYAHAVSSALRVHDKRAQETANLFRRGRLVRDGAFAELVLDSTSESGNLRDRKGGFRFLTAEMYDDVFFPKGRYVASNRIVDRQQEIVRDSKFDKYKSELKKFMFNPGQEIASVPFIGDKLALFSKEMAPFYDYTLDMETRDGHACWLFTAVARDSVDGKPADEDDTVIKRMRTWFDQETLMVIAREYRIENASLFLDFDISIKVRNTIINGSLVPVRVDYDGIWDIPFKKREIVRFYLDYSDWVIEP